MELALSDVELSTAQYRMLLQLSEGAEASTTLARKLAVTAPSVTAVVDGLVQRGLVARAHCEDDRRRVSLTLTENGREILASADHAVCRRLCSIADELGGGADTNEALQSLTLWDKALDSHRARRLAGDADRTGVITR